MPRSIQLLTIGTLTFWVYREVGLEHDEKHVEVTFKRERKTVFNLNNGEILAPFNEKKNGFPKTLPKGCLHSDEIRLAKKIIQKYKAKLLADWERLQQGKNISVLKM